MYVVSVIARFYVFCVALIFIGYNYTHYCAIVGGNNAKLEDLQKTLAHYGVTDGSTLMLIVLERFVLYIIALDGSMHEIEVPSSDPEVRYAYKDVIIKLA